MKFSEFFEDTESDRLQRQQALSAYQELIDILEEKGDDVFRVFSNGLLADRDALRHSQGIGIGILHDDTGRKVAGASPKQRIIFFYLDTDKPILPQLKKQRQRTSFVHEFQHLIDHDRAGQLKNTRDMDDDEYFNDPSETNAFYQQMVNDWEELWGRLSDSAKKNLLKNQWATFNDWMDYLIKNLAESDFIRFINSKNERKLKRRLYQYWDTNIKGAADGL